MASELKKRKDTRSKAAKAEAKEEPVDEVKPKYGPLPKFQSQRVWARGVMMLGVLAVVYFSSKSGKETTFASHKDTYEGRGQDVSCSEDYKAELEKFPGCVPSRCGRLVTDKVVTPVEAAALLSVAKKGLSLSDSKGGASILDLHSGAVSYGEGFVNIYKLDEASDIFQNTDFEIYRIIKSKIQQAVAHHFGVDIKNLFLTHPTFFSKLTNEPAKTIHDEYWHTHVDKETYEAFHFTSLLYLSDYGRDFEGGRFIFVDSDNTNRTVEPKLGRVSMFTSGSENTHYVERVKSGTRYAITVSFTCDKNYAISDPNIPDSVKRRRSI